MRNLKETKISSKNVYKGNFLDVWRDKVKLPNDSSSTREWIKHPGAACCVPILPNGEIALIRQFRYPIGKEMIEIPAGKIDKDENPKICASRELEEEIGYISNKITFLTHIHPAIGFTDEKMWIFLAENLVKTKQKLDMDEFLELHPTSMKDALTMIWDGSITDVKTIIGLLWVKKHYPNI